MPDAPSDRLRMLFDRAMALPSAARRAFVDHKCAADADLKRRLGELLAAAGDPQFAVTIAPTPAAPAIPPPARTSSSPEGIGSSIGPYRLLQLLGEGGFGAVYLAEQSQPVARKVALKILKLGMDTEQVVVRFEQERQALALMDHPHIAKVFDAGCTATGRPYFVMELCRGEPIVEYCDKNGVPIAERLELLEQVCHAIQHAHGKGIVHRDIKPSNVLVGAQDGRPSVKVIDFGIAKAIAQPLTERPLFTQQEQVIGTLQYMSPEQAEGSLDIDTRTDVYALGVLLYELLTGSTPFDQRTLLAAGLSQMHKMIREQEPPKPSTRLHQSGDTLATIAARRRVEPKRLGTLVRGELDWIAMKAIEKDRQRRYGTAEALAQDLQRFRNGEAVHAAPPSTAYRVRKFVRRNRALVAGTTAVTLSLLAGVVAFAWQARIAGDERDEARAAQTRAEEVVDVMQSLFSGLDPNADEAVAGSFKDRLIERLDTVVARLGGVRDPLARARLEHSFGSVRQSLGDHDKAVASFRSSLQAREQALGPDHPDTVTTALDLAWAMSEAGQPREAVALAERVTKPRLDDPRLPIAERRALQTTLGLVYHGADAHDQAIATFEALRASWDATPGPDTDERLDALQLLGAAYRHDHRLREAIPILRDVHARRKALLGAVHSDTLVSANSLAVALMSEKEVAEAANLLTVVRDGMLQRLAADHPRVISVENNLAGAFLEAGRTADALQLFEATHRRSLARHGAESPTTAQAGWALAAGYVEAGRDADAADLMARCYPALARAHGIDNLILSDFRQKYAMCLQRLGRSEQALAMVAAEEAQWQQSHGMDHPFLAKLRWERAGILSNDQKWDQALPLLREVVAAFAADPKLRAEKLIALQQIGAAELHQRLATAAIATLEPVLRERIDLLGADAASTLETQATLGAAQWMAGQFDRSLPMLEDTLRRLERTQGTEGLDTVQCALNLAANYRDADRRDDFIAMLTAWLPRGAAKLGRTNAFVLDLADQMAAACHLAGRSGDAVAGLELVYEHQVATLGREAPDSLAVGRNLGSALWYAGRLERSVPMLEDLLACHRKVFGHDAPDTLLTAGNLAVNLRDAGRIQEAVALFADTRRRVEATGVEANPVLDFLATEELATLARAGHRDTVKALAVPRLETIRGRHPAGSPPLMAELNGLATILLQAGAFREAEQVFREVVEVRQARMPDAWQTANSRALLGEALAGMGRFVDAEPLVVGGSESVLAKAASLPKSPRDWAAEAPARVRRFYTAWAAAEPGLGQQAKLAAWLAKNTPPTDATGK